MDNTITLISKFLDRRENCLSNQIPGVMKKYIDESIQLIEKIQDLAEQNVKLKEELNMLTTDV